jgi:hypothetical protein
MLPRRGSPRSPTKPAFSKTLQGAHRPVAQAARMRFLARARWRRRTSGPQSERSGVGGEAVHPCAVRVDGAQQGAGVRTSSSSPPTINRISAGRSLETVAVEFGDVGAIGTSPSGSTAAPRPMLWDLTPPGRRRVSPAPPKCGYDRTPRPLGFLSSSKGRLHGAFSRCAFS